MGGRPTKYAPDIVARIVQAIELGATYDLAAAYGGVSVATFTRWRQRYADFDEQVRLAEGHGTFNLLIRIQKASANGDWRAASWILERRYPDDYGKTVQQHNVTVADTAALRRVAEELAREVGVSFEEALAAVERAAAGERA